MARGGRFIYKKSNIGSRRLKNDEDDDDGDEEYVLGEDDEVEESESEYESDVNSRDLSEESFEFSESDGEIARSKKKRSYKKSRVSDDDNEIEDLSISKRGGRGRPRKNESRDPDFELDDDDEDDDEFLPDEEDFDEDEVSMISKRRGGKNGGKKRRSKVSKTKGRKKGRAVASTVRKRQKRSIKSDDEVDDDDFVVKDRVSVGRKRSKSIKAKRKRSPVDSDFLDSDFAISDDDFGEKDLVEFNNRRKNSKKVKKKKTSAGSARSKGRRKKRSVEGSEASDSDFVVSDADLDDDDDEEEDFIVKEQVVVDKQQKMCKKEKAVGSNKRRRKGSSMVSEASDSDYLVYEDDDEFALEDLVVVGEPVVGSNKRKRRKRSSVVSESSDSDYLVSEDGDEFVVKDDVLVNKQRKTSKKARKRRIEPKTTRRRSLVVSESPDSDYLVSEDDDKFALEDLVVVDEPVVGSNKRKRRKRSSVVLESSDSDYLVSEDSDEFVVKGDILVDKQRNKSKKSRKRRIEPMTTRRRLSSLVGSDSESFDFDDVISEEEVRDLRIGGGLILNEEQPKRILTLRKGGEKGKEKQADDSGKQVCGICLSEEKKTVIQGLLNCCSHYFCFACIMEWSRVESRCPLCKRRFETITKSGGSDPGFGMRGAVKRVQKRDQVYQPSEEELRGMLDPYENVVCMECQQGGDDNLMLLCDICDSSAHTYCVGLGREVPEGNWYCECCRCVNDGPSHSPFQDTMPDQEASNNSFPGVAERYGFTNVSTNSPQPVSMTGRSSSLRIDLNALPRDFPGEDHFVSSPISGSAASTVLGRRHIRQRIHVILTTNRQRHTPGGTNMLRPNSGAYVTHNGEASPASENLSPLPSALGFEQLQQNPRPFFRSHTNLAPCTFSEGSSLRHVDGAKEEVQRMVKSHLKSLSQNRVLDRSTLKEITRNSTHSILAACGIEHRSSMVSAGVEPPDNCTHDSGDGPAHLLKGCCSSCFSSFIKDVVQRLIGTTS